LQTWLVIRMPIISVGHFPKFTGFLLHSAGKRLLRYRLDE
jgi:hypothetical protein